MTQVTAQSARGGVTAFILVKGLRVALLVGCSSLLSANQNAERPSVHKVHCWGMV